MPSMITKWCFSYVFLGLFSTLAVAQVGTNPVNLWDGTAEISNSKVIVKTQGNEQPSLLRWELQESVNLNRKFIEFWFQLSSTENWFALEIRVSADENFATYASFPIRRYTDPSFGLFQEGVLRKINLSLGEAVIPEGYDLSKIKYIGLYAQDGGKGSFTIEASAPKITESKQNAVVSLTFDDGDASHFDAAKAMYRYGLRGTAYVMAREVDQPLYLSTDQLKVMQNKMGWGISSHHAKPLTEMTPSELEEEMAFEIKFLRGIGAHDGAMHFAYPLGKTDAQLVVPRVNQLFLTARRASDGGETLPPADWGLLRTVNITPEVTPEMLKARILKAQEQGEWLIFMFHKIVAGTPTIELEYNFDQFKKILDVIQETQVDVLPVHEVYENQRAQDL